MIALENRAIFLPAVGTNFWGHWKQNRRHRNFDLKWFSPHSFFRYPYALISAGVALNYNDIYWRDACGYPKDCLLMTDSGGFQLSKGKHIDPNVSLSWQELNTDIGIVLDVPVRKDSVFEENLRQSVKYFEIFERNRENHDMKLYNVIQGRNLQEMTRWWRAVKDFKFDGWCLSAPDKKMQVLGYLMLHENEAENLDGHFHLFGTTNTATMLTMAMLSKHFNTPITFDSTSYTIGSRFRQFLCPRHLKNPLTFGRYDPRIDANPCHCPVCLHVSVDDLYSQTNPVTPVLLDLHNMYQYIEVNNHINSLVRRGDPQALESYAESVGELETVQSAEVMLDAYENRRWSRPMLK